MNRPLDSLKRRAALMDHHWKLYADSHIDEKIGAVIEESPHSSLSHREIQGIFRKSKSIYFDTHIEVVSGHHTETYLQFESIAQHPEFISLLSRDMAQWVWGLSQNLRIDGLLVPNSEASRLAFGMATFLNGRLPLRVILAPFNSETGRIGTDVPEKHIQEGQNFVVVNDVTTRGNCVSKLAKIVTDHGGKAVGMMVFARRDSGQFPYMDKLMEQYPFYYGTALTMPQWEAPECPLCAKGEPLFSWRDVPLVTQDSLSPTRTMQTQVSCES